MTRINSLRLTRRQFNAFATGIPIAVAAGRVSTSLAQEATPETDPGGSPVPTGVLTEERPYLIPAESIQIAITPLLTAGEFVGDYEMAGNPSGIGGFSEGPEIELVVTHDLTTEENRNLSDSRVSHIVVDKTTGTITRASDLLDGSEGYRSLKSASKTSEKVGLGFPLTLTGEGSTTGQHGGIALAFHGLDWEMTELPWMGFMVHESQIVIPGFSDHTVVMLTDGDPNGSELYAYVADSNEALLGGGGVLHALMVEGSESATDLLKGEIYSGQMVPIEESDNTDAESLQVASTAAGAIQFEHLKSVAWDRNDGTQTVIYVSDAGKQNSSIPNGRVYRATVDPSDPTVVSEFEVLLDSGDGDDIRNPGSLTNNKTQLFIGESLKGYNRGGDPARVMVYDLIAGTLEPFAVVEEANETGQPSGAWEPAGLLNAGDFYGHGSMLGTVQAPSPPVEQFGGVDASGQLWVAKLA